MTRQRRYMRFQWKSMQEQVGKMEEQLTEMERQTAATREAADAALLNAEAVMRGERAWLLVEDITANAIDFIRHPHFSFRVVNYGRTPAQVQGYRAYCQISASDEIPDDRSFMEGSGGRGDDPIVPPHGEPLKISSTDMWPPFAIEPTQEEVEKMQPIRRNCTSGPADTFRIGMSSGRTLRRSKTSRLLPSQWCTEERRKQS